MRALTTAEWLNVWEAGLRQRPPAWVLTLLTVACPNLAVDTLAQFSIGQRDACLLTLREMLFGSQVATLTECPKCKTHLELTFEIKDIRVASPETTSAPEALSIGEWRVHFRLPNTLDLLAIANAQELDAARHALYLRCLLHAERNCEVISADQVPEQAARAVVAQMAELDPQGDVQLALACPACAQQWEANFDIVRFLWAELDAWAIRTVRDVHCLASAYGWNEADILALSSWRRAMYLELIGQG